MFRFILVGVCTLAFGLAPFAQLASIASLEFNVSEGPQNEQERMDPPAVTGRVLKRKQATGAENHIAVSHLRQTIDCRSLALLSTSEPVNSVPGFRLHNGLLAPLRI